MKPPAEATTIDLGVTTKPRGRSRTRMVASGVPSTTPATAIQRCHAPGRPGSGLVTEAQAPSAAHSGPARTNHVGASVVYVQVFRSGFDWSQPWRQQVGADGR